MVNPEVENSKELDSGEREIFFYRNAKVKLRNSGTQDAKAHRNRSPNLVE